tara:strand:- start:850 stop:4020 length:3171 start_codon:yes stop_codon:yes gene_type:complete
MDLNVNNLSVDKNGRVSFSGLGSNIDFQGVIDSIVAAKRIPIDRLETEVSTNESKIAALGDLRTLLTDVKDSLSTLHGAVSFGSTNDAFEIKEAFASASRTDGAVASNAANLIGVTVSNTAPVGGHTLEILQTAKAHKIASDAISSTTAALGFSSGDTFTFAITDANGDPDTVDLAVNSTMNLLGLRDLINAANKGSTATGVSASIVSVSTTEHYLVMTNEQTGADIAITETAGTPLQSIGIFDSGSSVKNELQASQKAQMYADGILDQTNTIYETAYQTASTVTTSADGQLEFFDSGGASIGTVDYLATDDLTSLASKITAAGLGITASVVTDGAGARMEITSGSAFTIAESGAGAALTELGVDNKRRVIERESNTVDDLFTGVTLSLFQAEVGTTINLDIERNLNEIKNSVSTFVESYNELRRFINDQRTLVETEDEDDETVQSGLLFSSEALDRADTQLSAIIGGGVAGVSSSYSVLAQIGVDFIPLGSEADPLDANILEIDESTLDNALLNNVEDIRRLFSFDFTPSDPRVSLLNFDGNTEYNAAGFTLNVQPNTGSNDSLYSEEFDNAYWNKVRSSISADAIAGPTGQMTADGLIGDATNNTHFMTNTTPFTVTAGETYTYSVYAKQGANDSTRVQLAGAQFPPESSLDVNLTTGTVTNEGLGLDGYNVEDAGNGWYRISITATASASGNATTEMYSMAGINTVYTGDGATADTYFSGAQLETAPSNATHVDTFSNINSSTAASGAVDDPVNSGNFGATEIIADTNNSDHGISNGSTASVTAGETYEYSAYLQAGDRSRARLSLNTGFGPSTLVDVRLDNGTILTTGAGADSAEIEDVGNGWYKVTLTATATSSETTTSMEARAIDAVSGLAFTGDGATASTYIYDMKMVATSTTVPGDYVPTTDTAQTGATASANIDGTSDGADDGSVTLAGNVLTINSGDAAGMELFFDGLTGPTSIDLNYTVGVGAQMFFAIEDMLDEATGTVETEIDGLTDTNTINEDRITEMLSRLEIQRRSLLERFIAMETALATNARILESVQASAESLNSSGN